MGRNTTLRRALVTLTLAVGLAVPLAPAAYADERDDDFVLALKRVGIVPGVDGQEGRDALVGWGHWSCDQLNQGAELGHVISWLGTYSKDYRVNQAMFVREATRYYCPAFVQQATNLVNATRPH